MGPRRRLAMTLQVTLLTLAAVAPAWAAAEGGGGFQSWLVEHRGLLWKIFYLQMVVFIALGSWEAVFQMQRKKAPPSRGSSPAHDDAVGDPLVSLDPFKTAATARRSAPQPPPTAPGPPPSLAQLARAADEEPRGARRLERIESGDTIQTSRVPTPPPPSPAPVPPAAPDEPAGESWADVLKRTTQDGSDRPQRRPVQIPPPAARTAGRIDAPPRKPEPEAEPPAEAPALSDEDMVAPRALARTVRPGTAPPMPATPTSSGALRMPTGSSRYAWDHAAQLLQAAIAGPCRLVPGGAASGGAVAGPSATLNLVTPPPAAAEKKRGRGMKLAAGGETRLGETYGRTTPIRPAESEPVPGFTGTIQSPPPPPAALQPVKRIGEPAAPPPPTAPNRSLSPPTTRMVPGMRLSAGPPPVGDAPPPPPPLPPRPPVEGAPLRPPPLGAPVRPSLSPPTTRMGPAGPPAPPAPRRTLDMPTRRIDLEPRTAEALRQAARSDSGEMPRVGEGPGTPTVDPSIQKENPDALRKSDGSSKILEIPKSPREKQENQDPDSNTP